MIRVAIILWTAVSLASAFALAGTFLLDLSRSMAGP